jgi:hypothetical protein
LKVYSLKINLFGFKLIRNIFFNCSCWIYFNSYSIDLINKSIWQKSTKDCRIRKDEFMCNWESMLKRIKLFHFDTHDLKIFIPYYEHRIRMWSKINMRKSTFFDCTSMLLLVKYHCNFKWWLYLAKSNKRLSTYSH